MSTVETSNTKNWVESLHRRAKRRYTFASCKYSMAIICNFPASNIGQMKINRMKPLETTVYSWTLKDSLKEVRKFPLSFSLYAAIKLDRWACGSASPNQSQTNAIITELWFSYSVKNTIRKHAAIPEHCTQHLNDLLTETDTLTA